jgi:1,2-diacylglycerol 3-alpha-glucosyltransferase
MSRRVAILFDNLGPYHNVRLTAAAQNMPVVALETCEQSREYEWERDASVRTFELRTLLGVGEGDGQTAAASVIAKRMFEALCEANPEVVAIPGWSTRSALAALSWCVKRHVPAVVMSESTAWDEDRHPMKEAIKQRVLKLFSAALVGGAAHASYLEMLGVPRDRIFSGYDVVDNDYFAQGAKKVERTKAKVENGLPDNYFLASARFISKKNLDGLIRAYAEYRKKVESGKSKVEVWDLVILGDGPLKSDLRSLISELRLERSVIMPGFKQYDELPVYYALANAFVHASTSEQWGLVVNEAMASGLTVLISNRCGCAQDLVSEGINGWTFDPFNVNGMAEGMIRLASLRVEERQSLGKQSYERIQLYSPTYFAAGLSQAVECALSAPRVKPSFPDRLLLQTLRSR